MPFITLFKYFQYLYYLRSYSTFWLQKKGSILYIGIESISCDHYVWWLSYH